MDDRGIGFRFPLKRREFYFSEVSPDWGDGQPAFYSMGPKSSFFQDSSGLVTKLTDYIHVILR
jgi:hypothetical protein